MTAFALTFLLNSNIAIAGTTSTATPKLRHTALTSSLLCTLVPAAAGAALVLDGSYSGQNDKAEALAGFAIGSVGIVLGPGVGHAYAGKIGRFWGGVAVRVAAVGLTVVMASSSSSGNSNLSSLDDQITQIVIAFVVGGSICLGSAIYDIATVGNSVEEYNEEHGFGNLTLKPTYIASHKAPGLLLRLTF